jgi:hypothetical protein
MHATLLNIIVVGENLPHSLLAIKVQIGNHSPHLYMCIREISLR